MRWIEALATPFGFHWKSQRTRTSLTSLSVKIRKAHGAVSLLKLFSAGSHPKLMPPQRPWQARVVLGCALWALVWGCLSQSQEYKWCKGFGMRSRSRSNDGCSRRSGTSSIPKPKCQLPKTGLPCDPSPEFGAANGIGNVMQCCCNVM